jgi:hypothetical protein
MKLITLNNITDGELNEEQLPESLRQTVDGAI